MSKAQGTTTYCWRREEIKAILDHCRKNAELAWLERIVIALACTGLRISELIALRWSDVDLKRNVIQLTDESTRPHRRRRETRRETKSGRDRSFPIHPDLQRVIDLLARSSDGLVFHGARVGRLKADTVRNVLIRDVVAPLSAMFPALDGETGFADGRLHSFRHYFCSACANENVPDQVVKEWLGHSDSKMVKHYYQLHHEEAQRQMKRLDFLGTDPAVESASAPENR